MIRLRQRFNKSCNNLGCIFRYYLDLEWKLKLKISIYDTWTILPFHVKAKIPKYTFYKILTLYVKQHVRVLLLLLRKNIRLCLNYAQLNKSFLHNNNIIKNTLHQNEVHLCCYWSGNNQNIEKETSRTTCEVE